MSEPGPGPRSTGGEVRPRLDRAPGERYGARTGAQPPTGDGSAGGECPGAGGGPVRVILAPAAAVLVGAAAYFGLGLVDVGAGTLAAAAAVGWTVALTLIWGGGASDWDRRTRIVVAGGLAGGSVVLGLLLGWAGSRVEGGVLPPLEYLDQRYGPLAWLNVLVAAVVGAWRAR